VRLVGYLKKSITMHGNMNIKKRFYQLDFNSLLSCSTVTVKVVSEPTPTTFRLNILDKLAQLAFLM